MTRQYITAIFFLLLSFNPLLAQWERLNGPTITQGEVGNITCIATNDSFVWSGTESSGIFRYNNLTPTQWEPINTGIKSFTIFSLTHNQSNLIATTDKGIYLSTNNGTTWASINNGLPLNRRITSFTISNGTFIASTSSLGIFRSTNNGQDWQQANNGLLDNNIQHLKASGNIAWALSRNAGLFKSENGGQSWLQVNTPNNCTSCEDIAILGNTIFIAQGSLLVSSDSGKVWKEDNSVENTKSITAYKGRLIANSDYRIFESLDSGKNWFLEPEFNLDSLATINVTLSTPNEIKYVATTTKGLYRGQIAAITWKPFNLGLLTANVKQIETYKGKLYATAYGTLYRSEDNGDNWIDFNSLFNVTVNSYVLTNDKLIIATNSQGIKAASTDFYVFSDKNTGLGSLNINKVLKRGNSIYALTDVGIYRSPNEGDNWFKLADNIDSLLFTDMFFDGNILYAGTNQGLYKSSNGGNNFERVDSNNLQPYNVRFIRKVNGQFWMGLDVFTHTSDDGTTWPRHFFVGGFTFANEISFIDNFMYASTNSGYLFKDTGEQEWHYMPRIEELRTNNFAKNNTHLFAGTGAGIWRLPLTNVVTSTRIPQQKTLTVYPNPATNTITIGNAINNVAIYSLSGKKIIECSTCNSINVSRLATGIYIIKARTAQGVLTQKLIKE